MTEQGTGSTGKAPSVARMRVTLPKCVMERFHEAVEEEDRTPRAVMKRIVKNFDDVAKKCVEGDLGETEYPVYEPRPYIPLRYNAEEYAKFSIVMPSEQYEDLDHRARMEGRPFGTVLLCAMLLYFDGPRPGATVDPGMHRATEETGQQPAPEEITGFEEAVE